MQATLPASHRAVVILTIAIQASCRDTGATAWIMVHHLHCFASLITITKGFTEELNAESALITTPQGNCMYYINNTNLLSTFKSTLTLSPIDSIVP